jgi:hypothetical protein
VLQFVQVYWVTVTCLSPATRKRCGAKPRKYSEYWLRAVAHGKLAAMNDRLPRRNNGIALLLALAAFAGCDRAPPELKFHWKREADQRAVGDSAGLEVDLVGGFLRIAPFETLTTGPTLVLEASSSTERLEPFVDVTTIDGMPTLRVGHPEYRTSFGRVMNEWRLSLAPEPALRLDVAMMSGICELKLGGLTCAKLNVHVEQGQLVIDFANAPLSKSCEVVAEVGTGQLRVRIPASPEIGVRVRARKIVGAVTVTGLREEKDAWLNDAFATAAVKLDLALGSGLGGEVVVEPAR